MTRQSAAVTFKNMVKKNWDPSEPDEVGAVKPVGTSEGEKTRCRGAIVGLMLRAI